MSNPDKPNTTHELHKVQVTVTIPVTIDVWARWDPNEEQADIQSASVSHIQSEITSCFLGEQCSEEDLLAIDDAVCAAARAAGEQTEPSYEDKS